MRSRLMCAVLLLTAVLAVSAFAAPPSLITNLIKGGSFDTYNDLKFWGVPYSGIDWQGVDAQSRTDSGVATIAARRSGGVSQCVSITDNRFYDFGARVLVTSSGRKPASARAYMEVEILPGLHCEGLADPFASAQSNRAVAGPKGRFTALSGQVFAPKFSQSALVTLFSIDPSAPAQGFSGVPALFDDVFLQESGGCVADDTTLCLGGGRLSARLETFDDQGGAHQAPVVQLSVNSGYFYTYSADDAEVTIKSNGASFVIGGMTNLPLRITVKDWSTGQQKVYTNEPVHFLSPIVDAFEAQ